MDMVPPPSKTYISSKFSDIYSVFLKCWTLKLTAFLVIQNACFCHFVPIPPFPKYIGFKIQDPQKTS